MTQPTNVGRLPSFSTTSRICSEFFGTPKPTSLKHSMPVLLCSFFPIRAIRDIRGQICKKRCQEELEG